MLKEPSVPGSSVGRAFDDFFSKEEFTGKRGRPFGDLKRRKLSLFSAFKFS